MNTIFGLEYQPFWTIVTILVCVFFGWLLYRIGTKIGRVADALVASNEQETQQYFISELDPETEDQVEDALDEKLK